MQSEVIVEHKVGIFDISNEDYHHGPGVSRSGLMLMKKSPLHFWEKYINPHHIRPDQTPALIFGSALHTYILEKDKFFKQYYVMPKCDKRTTIGKQLHAVHEAKAAGRILLSEEQFNDIVPIGRVSDTVFATLFEGAQIEKSIYWVDKATNILCKVRPDIMHDNMIVDLKSALDASARTFAYSAKDYGYHIQAAMIQIGIKEVTGRLIENFFYAVVEKEPPYATARYKLDPEDIKEGRREFDFLLQHYKQCLANNDWPTYPDLEIKLFNRQS